MPPPANAKDFLTVVERSGLLKEDDLDRYRFRSTADPSPPDRVAKWMLMDGRLTQFQVGLLLAGKSRPFFIGPYKVLARIGNGSMGVVYQCEHRGMGRKVAVKVLQNRRVQDVVALERFLREARATAALDHPNVVRALDFGSEEHLHYLVMEYIDGRSLKELVLADGALPPLKAACFLRQSALGLQHAHNAGLIHRDIKPSNLMINRTGVVKLLDLGLAKFEEGDVDLTQGKPLGAVAFIAPEQELDSHKVDSRADIYSLGATFYLALTGRTPKPGGGIGDAVPPGLTDTTNFERVMAVLRRMTARAPADRYASAAEVAAEMDVLLTPPTPPPVLVTGVATDAIETDELKTLAALGHPAGETDDIELLEREGVVLKVGSGTESGSIETIESNSSNTVTGSTPAMVELLSLDSLDPVEPSVQTPPKKKSQKRVPQARQRSRPVLPARWQHTHGWINRRWQPLILILAVVVGLLAAIATR